MRVNFNDGQEVTFQDLNKIMQLSEKWALERTLYHFVDKQSEGFFQDSLFVDLLDPTHVSVRAGVGIQEDLSQVSPESTRRMIYRPTATSLTLSAADGTNPRKDLIVVRADRVTTLQQSRNVKDFISQVVSPQNITVETDWLATLQVVEGVPAPSPVEPAVPSGFIKICTINVLAVTGPTVQSNLVDARSLMPILENTKIDTSGFANVTTKAVGTKLKTVLSELDALGASYAAVQKIYDAIVGSGSGATHATLAAAMAAVPAGGRILVTASEALNATVTCSTANVEVDLKPGVVISKGTATTGLNVTASGFKIHGGKISGFSGVGDKAINFTAPATSGMVWGIRFQNNDTDVDDSLATAVQFGNISE